MQKNTTIIKVATMKEKKYIYKEEERWREGCNELNFPQ
jgi:hypothetical protein